MPEKVRPLGVCDFCGGSIPRSHWYTSHRTARLHCSLECRQTANSRKGNPIRIRKLRKSILAGKWKNPRSGLDPDTIRRLSGIAGRKGRLREVQEGRWRNPALSESARAKLSRPRKHTGPLHTALEKMRRGKTADLSPQEHTVFLEYRRQLRNARREEVNRKARERYRKNKSP